SLVFTGSSSWHKRRGLLPLMCAMHALGKATRVCHVAEGFCVTPARKQYYPLSFVSDSWYQVSMVAPLTSLPSHEGRWSCQPTPHSCTGRNCLVPEPSHHQPSQEHPHAFAIGIHDVLTGP